jgi:4,5-DOPA dioxygenase extradiol
MTRMPVVFFGHGNPMNALADNAYTRGWRTIAENIRRPRAILMVSAHWYIPGTFVTLTEHPRTIHDFGGFPKPLFDVEYPAPGDPALAHRVLELLGPSASSGVAPWGLDHGTWSVLIHAYPQADVPVVQLSIDETKPPAFHFALGERLRALRDEDVLIAASGNIVHNLEAFAWGRRVPDPYDWALRFEQTARDYMVVGAYDSLVDYAGLGEDALRSVPTPDHYLPLLYALGAADPHDIVTFPVEGIDGGSISMLSAVFTC